MDRLMMRKPKKEAKGKVSKTPRARKTDDHLSALGKLLENASSEASQLFDHGLQFLLERLGVERVLMTRVSSRGLDPFWWASVKGAQEEIGDPNEGFCSWVVEHPLRLLVIKDAQEHAEWREHPGYQKHKIRSFVGVPLRDASNVIGTLSVEHKGPKHFSRKEIALISAIANLLGKTLEVETLKQELQLTRDALELTSAVVEDSALQSPKTGLPNMRYLEVWLKVNLFLARRRDEAMPLILWRVATDDKVIRALQEVAHALRGEDILVDCGQDYYLLLLPHTPVIGAEILLERIQSKVSKMPMGATLWAPDHDGLSVQGTLHRAELALRESEQRGGAEIAWRFAEEAL